MDDIQNLSMNNGKRQDTIAEDEINLLDYLKVIVKYRRMIVLICSLAVVATAIHSLLSPKVYSATASVVPPIEILQRESDLTGGLGAEESSILRNAMGVASIADMYAGILKSRAVVDAIIDRFDYEGV
jgi:tyrosine-protein kinase Etk/Wzc